jgi:hypothetical protein
MSGPDQEAPRTGPFSTSTSEAKLRLNLNPPLIIRMRDYLCLPEDQRGRGDNGEMLVMSAGGLFRAVTIIR